MAKNTKKVPATKRQVTIKTAVSKRPATKPRVVSKPVPTVEPVPLTRLQQLKLWCNQPLAGRLFMALCLSILFGTVLMWTILAARLHTANADQLIDAYLFENISTLNGAVFPGAHTFLLKWPLFALMQLFGHGSGVFVVATVLVVLVTLAGLVSLLHRIEKRPVVFGTVCLGLASLLLLVPAQPYPGALLPVNIAMTTTRNLEYLAFLVVLWFAVGIPKLKSWPTLGIGLLLTILIASDKLFGVLALGACLFAAAWYGLVLRRRNESVVALGWLLVCIAAFGAATMLLVALDRLHITGVSNGDSSSPFALVSSLKQAGIAVLFAIGAALTNFGANPVHDVVVLRDIPGALAARLTNPRYLGYAANLLLFALGSYAAVRLLIQQYRPAKSIKSPSGLTLQWQRLSVLLVGASLAAAAVYILTDHYYPVDARYLTIGVFTIVITAATYWSTRPLRLRSLGAIALLLALTIPFSVNRAFDEYAAAVQAMAPRSHVTARVSEEVDHRNVKRLVGDYWDVTPVKAAVNQNITIAPVDNCTAQRPALTSKAWFRQPQNVPTAYLAIRDGSPEAGPNSTLNHPANTTTYGGCSLEKVVGSYGVPAERLRIDNSVNSNGMPDVLLLLYPNGTKTPEQADQERKAAAKPKTPERKALAAMGQNGSCDSGISLQVVAHEDDDILFMNPDILMSIKAGRCMRTVFVTAGNAGESVNYWAGREQGAKAAYAEMFGKADDWRDESQYIGEHKVTVSYLRGAPKVSLVFLRLPDGNLHGEGFPGDEYASLHSLLNDTLPTITAVDGSSSYAKQDLVDTLRAIMNTDQADEIRTLGSDDQTDGDHADHHDVGILTQRAAASYAVDHTLTHYLGYPGREMPVNLSDDAIAMKQTIFLTYAKSDGAVCQTLIECQQTPTYGSYLARQYGRLSDPLREQPQPMVSTGP